MKGSLLKSSPLKSSRVKNSSVKVLVKDFPVKGFPPTESNLDRAYTVNFRVKSFCRHFSMVFLKTLKYKNFLTILPTSNLFRELLVLCRLYILNEVL